MATNSESQMRQAQRDREYLAACREHGIEADPAKYHSAGSTARDGAIDAWAHTEGIIEDFPGTIAIDESDADERPDFEIPAETKNAFDGLLNILLPSREVAHVSDQQVIGRRVLVLAWMMGRGPMAGESLAAIGRKIGVERATLSNMARSIEKATGFHARGQKTTRMHKIYSDSRKKVVERQQAEKRDARLPVEAF